MLKTPIVRLITCTLFFISTFLILKASFADATTGTIRGTVIVAGKPFSGVNIRLFSPGVKTPVDFTKSDSNGIYDFTGVTPGDYTLTTDCVNFKAATSAVTVVQDITSTIDFQLIYRDASFGRIEGSVRGISDEPLMAAIVRLMDRHKRIISETLAGAGDVIHSQSPFPVITI